MDSVRHNHSDDTSELLSAYVDGAGDIAERKRVEALIERCPACARDISELRALQSMLRDLPVAQPARSFTLDPATAPRPRALLFPTLRLATLVSVVLLFLVLGVDALGGAGSTTGGTAAVTMGGAAASAARQETRALSQADAEQERFGVMSASTAAEAAQASAVPSTATQAYAAASADASQENAGEASAASEVPPNDPAAAGAQTDGADGADGTANATAPEASAVESGALAVPSAVGYVAPPDAGDAQAGGRAETLKSTESSSFETVTAAGETTEPGSLDTLRIAEVLLALAAAALGLGALWSWRTGR